MVYYIRQEAYVFMKLKNITAIKKLAGKRVLVRVDFNVPLKNKSVADDYKIICSLPTIRYLLRKGASVVLISHLGRPEGVQSKYSLEPVAKHLKKLLGNTVPFTFHKIRKVTDLHTISSAVKAVKPKSVTLVDNIRFLPGEEHGDRRLAKAIAHWGDIFVLDGFAVAHRDSASVSGVARYLPSYAGLLLFDEVSVLTNVSKHPKRPLVVILGGIKVETKIPVLQKLLPKASHILVGGGIANTYWWAKGKKVGASGVGKKYRSRILRYCKNKKVILPVDVVVGPANGKGAKVVSVDKLSIRNSQDAIYDVGPKTAQLFSHYIKKANTLIWNGAMGMFEVKPYKYGTHAITHLFAARSRGKAFGVAGGGETVQVLQQLGVADDIDLLSTGGGAMLEFLGGKKLPGLKRLKKKLF